MFWKGVENIPATPWSLSCGRQGRDSERPEQTKPKHHCCNAVPSRPYGEEWWEFGILLSFPLKRRWKIEIWRFQSWCTFGGQIHIVPNFKKMKTISFALGSQKVATFGAKNKPLYKSGSLEIDCDLWDRSQCSGILDQFSTSHNSLLFFKKKMAPIDMSKQMNPTTQSDGIVLAEEASFSDAARVKGPHRKTSSSIVGLEVGWKALKGESLDFSTMLAIYLWHYRFEFSGSFIIRNPKEITWTAIYLWGKESRRRNVGWSSEKRFTRENPFFSWNGQSLISEFAFLSRNAWCAMEIFCQSQWNPNGGLIRSWTFSLKRWTQRRSIDHMWLCHRKGRTKNLAMHDYMVRSIRWWNWTLRTYKWMSKKMWYLHDPKTKPRMPRDVKTMPVSCPKSIWKKKHAPMRLTYQWSSEIEGLGTSDFETKHLKFEVFLSHFNKQWINMCHSIDICNHEVYFCQIIPRHEQVIIGAEKRSRCSQIPDRKKKKGGSLHGKSLFGSIDWSRFETLQTNVQSKGYCSLACAQHILGMFQVNFKSFLMRNLSKSRGILESTFDCCLRATGHPLINWSFV